MVTELYSTDGVPQLRSDLTLVELTRSGHNDAFGELWERHRKAALKAAYSLTKDHDPEDLAQEAFLRILSAIRRDGGPREAFRPYLYSVLRSISMSWKSPYGATDDLDVLEATADPSSTFEGQVIDKAITGRAFASLRSEWRAVLWYSEVEGMTPREIAPILGMTSNATAALTYRAREGLKASWLQAHINDASAGEECQRTVQRLGKYNRNSLSQRERDRVQDHLTTCLKCSILVEEVDDLGRNLGIMLLPLFLGPAGFTLSSALAAPTLGTPIIEPTTQALASTTAVTQAGARPGPLTGASLAKIGILTATLAIGGFAAVAAINITSEISSTVTAPTVSTSENVLPSVSPNALPAPTQAPVPTSRAPQETASPRVPVPPVANPVSGNEAAPPVAPVVQVPVPHTTQAVPPQHSTAPMPQATPNQTTAPPTTAPPTKPLESIAAPAITSTDTRGLFLPLISGTGVPGAVVHLSDGMNVVATARVDGAGHWFATPEAVPGPNGTVSFTARQTLNGLTSVATMSTEPVELLMPTFISLDTTSPTAQVTFSGPAGSTVEAFLDGKPTGNYHQMTGQPISRAISARGTHTLTLRFVDPTSGLHGASLNVEIDLP